MQYILSPEEMRSLDATAINKYGVSSALLMENAAHSSARIIWQNIEHLKQTKPDVLVFCGSGNNGGDGFAIARHLMDHCKVHIFWLGSLEKMTPETLANYESCLALGIFINNITSESQVLAINYNADVIIEAMIGVGGGENLQGIIVNILENINLSPAIKFAIDLPAGLNAANGKSHRHALIADHTITMFAIKKGMLLGDGPDICGKIHIAELGVPHRLVQNFSNITVLEKDDICKIIPERERRTSKFNYGRILIIAGSECMPGAGALAANAAIKSGAGLVELISTTLHPALLPEVMPTIVPANEFGGIDLSAMEVIHKAAMKSTVIAIGPGLGDSTAKKIAKEIIKKYGENKIIIVDADGLRAISSESELSPNIILTPHLIEFSRMTNIPLVLLMEDPEKYAREFAEKTNCTLLLKGSPTIITSGSETYYNIYGNPGMATAGAGDVLTGVISAIAGIIKEPLELTALAALIHSTAGDLAGEKSQSSLTATSIIENLSKVLP
jgi:NAD(P)H-hydrate epimerase